MNSRAYNIAIIGGGIIGCSLARELSRQFDGIVVLEKEADVGLHTSGRNSGVIHSGFNAKPGTLKARLCVEGSRLLRLFCQEHSVPFTQVGTLVVALDEAQLRALEELRKRGTENGVPGLEVITASRLRELEPNAKGLAALFSPTGSIVDSRALTQTMARDAEKSGVTIALNQRVVRLAEMSDGVHIETNQHSFSAGLMINCAGLHADRLAHLMGVGRDYIIAPFRGEYFVVERPGEPIVRSMVYSVPDPAVPFLGIHLTRTVAGSVLVGPNAVPALGREAYESYSMNLRDLLHIANHRGFWNVFKRNRTLSRIAWREWRRSFSRQHFLREASRLVEGLKADDLRGGLKAGIRPQLIDSKGMLVDDLVIEATDRTVHVLNAVSPGMTSALAFAKWVTKGIDQGLRYKKVIFGDEVAVSS